VDFDSAWHVLARRDRVINAVAPGFKVVEREIGGRGMNVLSWQWALVGGVQASGFIDAKVALVRARLSGHGTDSTGVALITPIEGEDVAGARTRLQEIAQQLQPTLGSAGAAGPVSR
jgi:EpsI family protein